MYKYYDALLNRSGDALAGHYVRLFDAAGNQVDIYADESLTPIISESGVANAAKSDDNGMVRFFVESGDYDMRLYDATDTFVSAERAVPMVRGITDGDLSVPSMASGIGEISEGNVQAALDARPTTAALASSTGGEMVGIYGQDGGATTLAAEVARLQSAVPDPRRFGVVGNGVADDTAAWQAWIAFCAANKLPFHCAPRLVSRVTGTLHIPRVPEVIGGVTRCLSIDLREVLFLYDGPRDRPVIDIGIAPAVATYYIETDIFLPMVKAVGALQWPTAAAGPGVGDIGIRIRQALRCRITESYVYGFTNGIVYVGCAYNSIFAKHISDSRYGLVYTTEGATVDSSFSNENVRIGGKIGNTSLASGLGSSASIVFSWDKLSSYRGHNANRFIAPCLEGNGSPTWQLPIWFDGVGGANSFEKVRLEGMRGPVALFDGAGGARACGTSIDLQYIAYTHQEIGIRQVNGACGNRLTGIGCATSEWHSGDMTKLLSPGGGAGAACLTGREFFFLHGGTPVPTDIRKHDTATPSAVKSNRRGIHLDAGGYARVGVAIDTTRIKDFEVSYQCLAAHMGRPQFLALDAQGALLTGKAVETVQHPVTGAVYPDEFHVKAMRATGDQGQQLIAGTTVFAMPADSGFSRLLRVTVRPEVKTLLFCIVGAASPAVVQSMSVKAFAVHNVAGETYANPTARGALRVFCPIDERGTAARATADPGAAGTLGFAQRGDLFLNSAAASGQPMGWQCSASGWLAPAWVAASTYAVEGMLVTNDGGKIYEITTPGTSAGSGGPTGTTASWDGIADGTCKWRYIGTKAAFVAMANAA